MGDDNYTLSTQYDYIQGETSKSQSIADTILACDGKKINFNNELLKSKRRFVPKSNQNLST
jgi:hypothetical protein